MPHEMTQAPSQTLPPPPSPVRQRVVAFANRHAIVLWFVVFGALALVFGLRQRGELSDIWQTLTNADPRWVALTLVIQLGMVALIAGSYGVVLTRLGVRLRLPALVAIHLQRVVAGTLTPLGGPASVYVYARNLGGRGVSADDALLSIAVRTFAAYAAFLLLLAPALALGDPTPVTLGGAAFLLAAFAVGLVGIWRVTRVGAEPARWLPARFAQFVRRVREHGMGARDFVRPFLFGMAIYLAGACALFVCLHAVGVPASPRTALVGYVVGTLFTIVAPFFSGIGIVELSIIVALTARGVEENDAIAAALLYRVGDVWFPLLLGVLVEIGRRPRIQRLFLKSRGR
jgi:uncharacterized membrane protein YbhN (UPF0104 family)